jgi:hypothetical protein
MSTQNEEDEEQKKQMRMNVIYKALEEGWSVKKTGNDSKTFEFSKKKSLKEDYKGLVIFSKSAGPNICDDIEKHLENIERTDEKKGEKGAKNSKRSVSTPIIKNT